MATLVNADVSLDPVLQLLLEGLHVGDGPDANRNLVVLLGTPVPETVLGESVVTSKGFINPNTSTCGLPCLVVVV